VTVLSLLAAHEAAEALLGCVCEALDRLPEEVAGLAGCPCRVGVVPGQAAADGCDGGCNVQPGEYPGQLTVGVARMYPSDPVAFPRESGTGQTNTPGGGVRDNRNCALPQTTAVELVVTLFRCVPTGVEPCPPTMVELGESAMQLHADMLAAQQGVLCCFNGTDTVSRRGRRYVMGQTVVLGPQGGCIGFELRVVVALDGTLPPITP
jgi:hypothetical protein